MPPGLSSEQSQLDHLGTRLDQGFGELKTLLYSFDGRLRAIEHMEAGCQPIVTQRIDGVLKTLSDHETRLATKSQQINTLEKQVQKMLDMYEGLAGMYKTAQKVVIAMGIAFFTATGGFIWALIVHRAEVIFK